jgi:hypothetical protein
MFRQFSSNAYHFHNHSAKLIPLRRLRRPGLLASTVAATWLWYSTASVAHSDSLESDRVIKARDELTIGFGGPDGALNVVVWGSNKCVADPHG